VTFDYGDALSPQGAVTQREWLLYWTKHRLQAAISQERLSSVRDAEVVVEHTVDQMMVRLQTDILTDRVLGKREQVSCRVAVPWSCTVMVEVPRSWWRRWLRRPARQVWKDVSGTVETWGQVEVHLEHLVMFPDPKRAYPKELGRPVQFSQVEIGGAPMFDVRRTTARGPHAAERGE
jgi:hypothetical protein